MYGWVQQTLNMSDLWFWAWYFLSLCLGVVSITDVVIRHVLPSVLSSKFSLSATHFQLILLVPFSAKPHQKSAHILYRSTYTLTFFCPSIRWWSLHGNPPHATQWPSYYYPPWLHPGIPLHHHHHHLGIPPHLYLHCTLHPNLPWSKPCWMTLHSGTEKTTCLPFFDTTHVGGPCHTWHVGHCPVLHHLTHLSFSKLYERFSLNLKTNEDNIPFTCILMMTCFSKPAQLGYIPPSRPHTASGCLTLIGPMHISIYACGKSFLPFKWPSQQVVCQLDELVHDWYQDAGKPAAI